MIAEMLILALLAGISTFVQTIAGFGGSFFILPALLVFFNAPTAITFSLLLGNAICLLVLFAEKRKREFSWPLVLGFAVTALPGLLMGAYVVTRIDKEILQIAIGILIIAALLVQEYAFPQASKAPRFSWSGLSAGFLAGVLNASAALAAPPLVLWLRSRIVTPNQFRDTLAVCFLLMNQMSIVTLYIFKPEAFTPRGFLIFASIAPIVFFAHRLGKYVLPNISSDKHKKIIFYLVILAGLSSIILGISELR
jgi:uncharacterized protein